MGFSFPNPEDESLAAAQKELAAVQEFRRRLGEVSGRLEAAHRDLVSLLNSHPCGREAMRRELPLQGLSPEMFHNQLTDSVAIPAATRN